MCLILTLVVSSPSSDADYAPIIVDCFLLILRRFNLGTLEITAAACENPAFELDINAWDGEFAWIYEILPVAILFIAMPWTGV